MLEMVDFCVSCEPPHSCDNCRNRKRTVVKCDICGDYADYIVNGDDMCKDCTKEYMQAAFDNLSLIEQAKILNVEIEQR